MPLISTITPTPNVALAHHRIHEGSHFSVHNICHITVGSFRDFIVITPPMNQAVIHMIFECYIELGSELYVYEDVQITNSGTLLKSQNQNRISSTTSSTLIYIDPTLVAGEPIATKKMFEDREGSLSESGLVGKIDREENEFVLKSSTNYLFRIIPDPAIAAASIYAAIEFNWYDARASTIS